VRSPWGIHYYIWSCRSNTNSLTTK
jgi:hypothetical protein